MRIDCSDRQFLTRLFCRIQPCDTVTAGLQSRSGSFKEDGFPDSRIPLKSEVLAPLLDRNPEIRSQVLSTEKRIATGVLDRGPEVRSQFVATEKQLANRQGRG